MKKKCQLLWVFLFIFFIFSFQVRALDYKEGDVFPISDTSTVTTENFTYKNFRFNGSSIVFESIKNLTKGKVPISVSIGLFDNEKKNIGIINYCSNEDYESDFSGLNLKKGERTNFSILVKEKYLQKGFTVNNIAYIGIINDNQYCKVGGATNYIGKTMEQIRNQESVTVTKPKQKLFDLKNITLTSIVLLLFILFIHLVYGFLVNDLHARMYGKTTILSWIPIFNSYLGVKVSIGKPIALIYLGLSLVLGIFGKSMFKLVVILSIIVAFCSFIIIIIKLITKNYDLFIINNIKLPKDNFDSNDEKTRTVVGTFMQGNNLFTSNKDDLFDDDISNSSSISMGGINSPQNTMDNSMSNMNNNFNSMNNNFFDNNSNNQEDDDSSDLKKFFR